MTENLQTFCCTIFVVLKTAYLVPRARRRFLVYLCFPLLLTAAVIAIAGTSYAQSIEWDKVDAGIGRKATLSGDVHRYGFPRTDLNVSLDDVILKPAFALGGWAGLAASKTPLEASATGAAPALEFDTEQLDQILGVKGKANGGVYQFALPRRERIREGEMTLVPAGPMGVATSINFQPTGGGKAAITGDFVLAANEVNPVIRALRENEIEVTAVHSHMLAEQPRLFFMHFWANDQAIKLANGLRAALDQIALAKD